MADSGSSAIGLINLDMKETGKPSAGNLHAGFDVAGAGNQLTVWLMRHSQRKRRATDRPNLRGVAPVLDPTCERLGVRFPGRTSRKRLVHSVGNQSHQDKESGSCSLDSRKEGN
jgi:hypothetical protein